MVGNLDGIGGTTCHNGMDTAGHMGVVKKFVVHTIM